MPFDSICLRRAVSVLRLFFFLPPLSHSRAFRHRRCALAAHGARGSFRQPRRRGATSGTGCKRPQTPAPREKFTVIAMQKGASRTLERIEPEKKARETRTERHDGGCGRRRGHARPRLAPRVSARPGRRRWRRALGCFEAAPSLGGAERRLARRRPRGRLGGAGRAAVGGPPTSWADLARVRAAFSRRGGGPDKDLVLKKLADWDFLPTVGADVMTPS